MDFFFIYTGETQFIEVWYKKKTIWIPDRQKLIRSCSVKRMSTKIAMSGL